MISQLRGTVEYKDIHFVVLDVHGVGYKVFVAGNTIAELLIGSEVTLVTHLVVREDCLDIYGFLNREELRVFELLISISGIGPKSALAILNTTTIENLKHAVAMEDATHLTRVSGIGRKIAEKILLELRGKLEGEETTAAYLKDEIDVIEALRSLGYSPKESQDALKKIPRDIAGAAEKVKHALKILSN